MKATFLLQPIDLRPEYVYNGLAYTMAKYNASLCTIGEVEKFIMLRHFGKFG